MKKRFTLVLAVAVATVLAVATSGLAQGLQTGTLSGVVKDPDGLPLPGATVTATSSVLQGERTAVTDAIGAFIIRGLPPGGYTVRFQFTGTSDVLQSAVVPLGGVAQLDVTMRLAGVQEAVQVTADATPPALAQTQISTNFTAELVSVLPVGRRPFEIAELAPGVTDATPNVGQMAIGGAFAFDSIFLIDGVDANDNLFGTSNNLFIEDAILETQVLVGGISAEYGRFGGGVVNVITRSGGNDFHGSFRVNYARPSWTQETPFQRSRNETNSSTLAKFYEGTVGGPIVKDRLWFFNGDRYENSVTGRTFPEVGGSYDDGTKNKRFELKITGTPVVNHTVSGTFVNNPTSNFNRPSINATMSIEQASLVDRQLPNRLFVMNWNGALSNKMFATFQYSSKQQGFRNTGGTETAITRSPILSRGNFGIGATANRHFNAPYFSSNDPEDRNNRQFAGSLSYFVTNPAVGRHDFKVGGEHFNSWRTGGNSQSATGYVFETDYRIVGGQIVPQWTPAAAGSRTRVQNWISAPGAVLHIKTLSLYVQDRWQVGSRITADLGLRFENADTEATGDIVGADTSAWLPRLGVSVDLEGNGRTIAQATYGRYSGRFTERAFARNTNVGTPSLVLSAYTGPEGTGKDFAPAFNLANYTVVGGNFPTANVFFDSDLRSPKTNEVTLALGRELPRGYAKVTYSWRTTTDFIESFINDPSAAGKTTVVRQGINYGTFDNVTYRNTSVPKREYQAVQFEGRTSVIEFLPITGHYTVQIRNHGNFEGEAANQPGNASVWFDYPEMLPEDRYYPYGRLDEFQRHKFRVWTTYNQKLGRLGSVDVSPIWRVNSGLTYSHTTSVTPTAIQIARNPGYARANTTSNTIFFGGRGTENFKGYGVMDVSFRYGVPVWKSVQPWIQAHVYNVLNNQKQIQWNTTVTGNTAAGAALDANGLPATFNKGATYGTATANGHFPVWSSGEAGSRTIRVAMGIRF